MKRFFTNSIILAFFSIAIIFLFSTCKKDKDCKVVITVKYQGDTTKTVPDATVKLYSKHTSDNFPTVNGVSDGSGQFTYTYKLEAILDVESTKDTDTMLSNPLLYGTGMVRLKPGQTAYKTIFLN